MLSIYQAAYEGKLFIVKQMLDKDQNLIGSFDEVKISIYNKERIKKCK